MRLSFFIFLILICATKFYAQVPEKMSYQAIVRGYDQILVSDSAVSLRVLFRQGSPNGKSVYEETHTSTTNLNGLVSLEIGNGNVVSGEFSEIPWQDGPFFIETQVDPNGGTNYSLIGVSQLLSTPFALHAKTADRLVNNGNYALKTKVISFQNNRSANSGDIGNIIECTSTATLKLTENFVEMNVGDIINLEIHNGAKLTVETAPQVLLNYKKNGNAIFESSKGTVRFGLLRKLAANSYIISGQ